MGHDHKKYIWIALNHLKKNCQPRGLDRIFGWLSSGWIYPPKEEIAA